MHWALRACRLTLCFVQHAPTKTLPVVGSKKGRVKREEVKMKTTEKCLLPFPPPSLSSFLPSILFLFLFVFEGVLLLLMLLLLLLMLMRFVFMASTASANHNFLATLTSCNGLAQDSVHQRSTMDQGKSQTSLHLFTIYCY